MIFHGRDPAGPDPFSYFLDEDDYFRVILVKNVRIPCFYEKNFIIL